MLVIGLGHKARRGKDTLANHLVDLYKGQFDIIRAAYADELKREVNEAVPQMAQQFHREATDFQFGMEQLCKWARVEYDPNPDMSDPLCPYGKQRRLLQWWGTEYRRNSDAEYWTRKMDTFLVKRNPDVVIITDMRFPNEMEHIKRWGGVCWRLDRPGFVSDVPEHISETALNDATFDNVIAAEDVFALKLLGVTDFLQTIVNRGGL